MVRKIGVTILIIWTATVAANANAAGFDSNTRNTTTEPLSLLRITPDGEDVPASRQIVFQFNQPVVPVGRMERTADEIPVTITPELKCEWRWLNTTSLACQLGKETQMKPATRYTVTMKRGIKTEAGKTISETVRHEFLTQRPKVSRYRFKTWTAPGKPKILVIFNQPVNEKSVQQHLYFALEDGKRVSADISEDPEIAKAYERMKKNRMRRDQDPGLTEFALEAGRELMAWVKGQEDSDRIAFVQRNWIVTPAKELPLDHNTELRIEPGVQSVVGPEPGVEDRVAVRFDTFPEFRFLGLKCSDNSRRQITIAPDEDTGFQRCNPLQQKYLLFSAPVVKEAAKEGLKFTPDLAGGRKDFDPWASAYSWSQLSSPHRRGREYSLAVPVSLKAHQDYSVVIIKDKLKDEFGRELENAPEFRFATDHRLPEFELKSQVSVLEEKVDTHLPVVVTNLKDITLQYNAATADGYKTGETTLKVDKAQNIAYHYPLKIRELIPGSSGAVNVQWQTDPPVPTGYGGELRNWFFSQVTPYSVHVKIGHYNSLAWVTRFDNGQPVRDAKVELFVDTFGSFRKDPDIISTAATNAAGVASFAGTEKFDPQLKVIRNYRRTDPHFFIRVTKGKDIALVPLVSDYIVQPSIVSPTYSHATLQKRYGHIHTWGFTAQGVYKAGDEIDFKIYVRDQDNKRFVPAPKTGYALKVMDPMRKVVHEVKSLELSGVGAYDGKFTVPENGAVGWYQFQLSSSFSKQRWQPLQVLVSDFTPAAFRVSTDLNGELFKPGDELAVTTLAKLHAGGPYADADARITARVQGTPFQPSDPKAHGYNFDVFRYGRSQQQTLHQNSTKVDSQGSLVTEFKVPKADVLYGRMQVESAVRDDRGKYLASSASATYVGRDRYVGVRQPDWVLKVGKPTALQSIVVSEHGKVVVDTPISVKIRYRETTASRVKGSGNAYLTRYTHKWIDAKECTYKPSPGKPVSNCSFTPRHPGLHELIATIRDSQGREHSSRVSRWTVGPGQVIWEDAPGNSLTIIPEKNEYKVGDVARYLVKNPYPGAKALVTVERFGVQKQWVKTLASSTEVIEVKITPNHLPGFYLSVVVTSPRVDKPLGDNQVDLGKPAFRMGYVRSDVKDPVKELKIAVSPRKKVVKPGGEITVDLKVNTASSELAVVALDEAVFDLIQSGEGYFDPYKGFYTLDSLDMANYSLLTRLLGIQKFEKKGANSGGDGGRAADLSMRSVFKYIGYWNPALKPDAQGKATIRFTVPDNLTGWRVMAIGVTPSDRMGLGRGLFKVNQSTEIRPSIPNQVTEGDRFEARFTVMNRTDKTRNLSMTIKASGAIQPGLPTSKTFRFVAAPYKRHTFGLPVKAGRSGKIEFIVQAGDVGDRDGLRVPLVVNKRKALETAATYGTTTAKSVSERLEFPANIRTDVGEVSVVTSPTVIGGLEGVFDYMREYPYVYWESVLTKGVMASHYLKLKPYLSDSLKWPEARGLPEATLKRAGSYQAPNGGMSYYIPSNRYVDPYLSAYTAISFNWLRKAGYTPPQAVEQNLHRYLLNLLRRDALPDFYSAGMGSTVRAVALAALSEHDKVSLSDLQRYHRHVEEMTLFGKAHFLMALTRVEGTGNMQSAVMGLIRAHANETGGKFVFGEQVDFVYKRMLNSSLRTNCSVLNAFLVYEDPKQGNHPASDVPFKLVRTLTQTRKNKAHWENTQENMFCMNALIEFGRVYEDTKPNMTVSAFFNKALMGKTTYSDFRDQSKTFNRAIQKGDEGRKATVKIDRQGEGRLYYSTRMRYSPKILKTDPINAGMEVKREYSVERDGKWQLLTSPMAIRQGELVRVDLYLTVPTARNFVVVDDPVPGGLEPVNRDLATASRVDADKGKYLYGEGAIWWRHDDWREYGVHFWSFYHKELRHHAARFYSQYLPEGRYHLSYTAQAIAPGEFTVMPTHAEEMYDPDVFGQEVPAVLKVDGSK